MAPHPIKWNDLFICDTGREYPARDLPEYELSEYAMVLHRRPYTIRRVRKESDEGLVCVWLISLETRHDKYCVFHFNEAVFLAKPRTGSLQVLAEFQNGHGSPSGIFSMRRDNILVEVYCLPEETLNSVRRILRHCVEHNLNHQQKITNIVKVVYLKLDFDRNGVYGVQTRICPIEEVN